MIVDPDLLLEQGPGRYDPEKVARAWSQCFRRVRDAIADPAIREIGIMVGTPGSGKSTIAVDFDRPDVLIFDAVWGIAARRAAFARQLVASGSRSFAVWVRCPLRVALERNAARPAWRRVPRRHVIESDARLKRAPPSKLEGWNRIAVVRTG